MACWQGQVIYGSKGFGSPRPGARGLESRYSRATRRLDAEGAQLDASRGSGRLLCIVEGEVLTLNLGIRRRSGAVQPLGKYRLDLRDLAAKGVVNHREDGQFTVQINHVNGGAFNLGTRHGVSTPLAAFKVA